MEVLIVVNVGSEDYRDGEKIIPVNHCALVSAEEANRLIDDYLGSFEALDAGVAEFHYEEGSLRLNETIGFSELENAKPNTNPNEQPIPAPKRSRRKIKPGKKESVK